MKDKKKIILISVLAFLVVLVGIFFIVRSVNKNKRIEEIKEFMKSSYDKVDENIGLEFFKNQELNFDFEKLKLMGLDIEKYEKNKCNFDKSKVTLKFDDDANYEIEVKLSCFMY